MGRWVIRSVNVGIFVLCCFLAAGVFNRISAEMLSTPPVSAPPSARAQTAPGRTWQDRKAIVDRNLFGAQLGSGEPVLVEPEEDLAKTRLPLRLLGTAASPEPTRSTAAVEDQNTREHEVVRVGDHLQNHPTVEVLRIEPRRIVLQNGARREELVLDETLDTSGPRVAAARPARRAPPARRTSPLAERLQQLSENRFAVTSQGAQALERNPASLLQDCRPVPERGPDNQIVGYRLSAVREGGICDQAGIQSGEIITEVNGLAIDNPTALSQLLTELASADEWNVVVRGADGRERPVSITTRN